MSALDRWPGWVYGVGVEPDQRVSLANERTFLAWVRTSLALLAGGVALDAVDLSGPGALQSVIAVVLVLLGLGCAVSSWMRWAYTERAVRLGLALPSTTIFAWLALVLVLVAAALVVLVGHLAVDRAGRGLVAVCLVLLAAVIAFCWLDPQRRAAAAGAALVAGVAVLGVLGLAAILGE